MRVSEAAFAGAVLNPEAPVPAGIAAPMGAAPETRFAVYRNNVASGLIDALGTAFPVIRALVGDEFFRAMAGLYFRAHPPASPILWQFGEVLPAFLETFPPARSLGYLPDMARLEIALRESYHAADAAPLGPEALTQGAELLSARVSLAPAVRILRSPWPIFGIWRAHRGGAAPEPRAEDVLVARPAYDPVPSLLPPGAAAFVAALRRGEMLGRAIETAGPGFDPGPTLGLLLSGGAITNLSFGTES